MTTVKIKNEGCEFEISTAEDFKEFGSLMNFLKGCIDQVSVSKCTEESTKSDNFQRSHDPR